jgi:hypothetical protein
MGEIARTVGALLALGVVAVLRAPLAVLSILVVMVVAATFMVTARLTGIAVRDHWRRPAAVDVAVVSGAGWSARSSSGLARSSSTSGTWLPTAASRSAGR